MDTMAWRLQSSVHGKIKRLLIIDSDIDLSLSILSQMYDARSPHMQLVFWSNSHESSGRVERELCNEIQFTRDITCTCADRVLLVCPPENGKGSVERWVRDGFFIFHGYFDNQTHSIGITSSNFGDDNYNILKHLDNLRLLQKGERICWLTFDGGHILDDNESMMLSKGAFENMLKKLCIDDFEKGKVILGKYFGRDPKHIHLVEIEKYIDKRNFDVKLNRGNPCEGVTDMPEYQHIDLFVTFTGKMVKINGKNKSVILIAQMLRVTGPNAASENKDMDAVIDKMNNSFRNIETDLGDNFHVVRNIVPLVDDDGDGGWITHYYNNCLVENTSDSSTVWLPCYVCSYDRDVDKILEFHFQSNIQLWRAIGFEVKIIKADFTAYSSLMGSLHCLTKELIREID